jgi:Tfp pilus assembly protein PilF
MAHNDNRTARKSRLALLLAISLTPCIGCASLKSPKDWFSSSTPTSGVKSSSWSQSLAGTGIGIGNQFKSVGSTMTSAVGKAKNAVVSTFSPKGDGTIDPQTSLADMPNSLGPEIWVTNGQVFEMKGNYAAALDNYTKALEKEPDNLAALQSVARLQTRQEQHTQAIETYQKVIRVSPTAENYSELASAQQKAGKLNDAQASLQKAISLDPSVARFRNNLAGVLVSMGRSDEAVKELQNVFPPAVANYNVAYLHFMNKNMAATQQHLQLALQADPNLQKARDLLNTLNQSQTGQTALAAYDVANQAYRTAQGTAQGVPPGVQPGFANAQPVSGISPASSQAPSIQYSQLPQMPAVNR